MGTALVEALLPQLIALAFEYVRRRQAAGLALDEAELEAELRGKVAQLVAEADAFLREKGV